MHHTSRRSPPRFILVALILAAAQLAVADEDGVTGASAHLLQAEIALQAEDYLEAAAEYRKAAELSDSVEIARRATRVAFEFGFDRETLRSARRWLELEPDDEYALRVVAQLQLRLGETRDARRNFQRYIDTGDGSSEKRLFSLLPDLADEDPERADALMRSLSKPYKDSALINYASAVLALQAGDIDYATEKTTVAIELDQDWLKPKLLYSRILLRQGQVDEAIDHTARIIGDDPDPDPDARLELALMYLSVGRDDDALSQVNQILLEQSSTLR